jgi:hypothetical protein
MGGVAKKYIPKHGREIVFWTGSSFFLSTPADALTSHDFVGKEEGENFLLTFVPSYESSKTYYFSPFQHKSCHNRFVNT